MTAARAVDAPVLSTPRGELRALTGLRIVAAAWVVLFHFHFTALPWLADLVAATGPLITSGALGVDLFFVLSGFVIAYTYLEKLGPALRGGSAARFVWARAARLWPAYVVVLNLFGLWIAARLFFGSDDTVAFQPVQPVVSVGAWVEQMFMVQLWDHQYFDGASWVGSTWSISAEWLAYVLFPVAALVFHRMRNLPRPVLALGALALMAPIAWSYLSTGNPYYPWSWLVRILCGFGAGVLAYLVVRRTTATPTVRRVASRVADVTVVLIVAGLCLGEFAGPGRGGSVIALFPVLVGSLALADRGVARVLSTRWMVHGGRVSYSLYLVHIPMFEVYWLAMAYVPALWQPTPAAHLIGAAVLLLTFPVAMLLRRLVEEPGRLRLRALGDRTRRPAADAEQDAPIAAAHPPLPVTPAPPVSPAPPVVPVRPAGRVRPTGPVHPTGPVPTGPPAQRRPRHAAGAPAGHGLAMAGGVLFNGRHRRPEQRPAGA